MILPCLYESLLCFFLFLLVWLLDLKSKEIVAVVFCRSPLYVYIGQLSPMLWLILNVNVLRIRSPIWITESQKMYLLLLSELYIISCTFINSHTVTCNISGNGMFGFGSSLMKISLAQPQRLHWGSQWFYIFKALTPGDLGLNLTFIVGGGLGYKDFPLEQVLHIATKQLSMNK